MKPIGQAIRERLQKAIRAIESRAAHPKEIRSREDTYPFVLLVIAVILGWAWSRPATSKARSCSSSGS